MKKLLVLLIMVFFGTVMVNAQMRMTPKERAADLKEKLALNDEQAKKVEIIFTESAEKAKELREKYAGNRADMMKAMLPLNEENDKKIDSLLTDNQKEKYLQVKKERREKMGRRTQPQN